MQQAVSSSAVAAPSRGRPMPMVVKLAYRNLFHDRLSLVVTLVGIVFSVVLIAVQFGLYIGSEVRIAAMLDQTRGDLWVIPYGTKSFDDPTFLEGQVKHPVLSTPGIASVEELVAGFVGWRRPAAGTTAALLVGSDTNTNTSRALGYRQRQHPRSLRALRRGGRSNLLRGARHQGSRRPRRDQRHLGDGHRPSPTTFAPSPRCPTSSPPWPWRARCSARRPTCRPTRS